MLQLFLRSRASDVCRCIYYANYNSTLRTAKILMHHDERKRSSYNAIEGSLDRVEIVGDWNR